MKPCTLTFISPQGGGSAFGTSRSNIQVPALVSAALHHRHHDPDCDGASHSQEPGPAFTLCSGRKTDLDAVSSCAFLNFESFLWRSAGLMQEK